jgi:hypothetical protein
MSPNELDEVVAALLDAVDRAIAPVLGRLDAIERDLGALGDRLTTVDRAGVADHDALVTLTARALDANAHAATVARVAVLEAAALEVAAVRDVVVGVRERVAAVEARPAIPGPAGTDGAPGRDGIDGFGFDDVTVEAVDDGRTLVIKFVQGDRVRAFPVTVPTMQYRGVYRDGVTYRRGDWVTWAGSTWHCDADATIDKPGDRSRAWVLAVKCGRDGARGPVGPVGPAGKDWSTMVDEARRA